MKLLLAGAAFLLAACGVATEERAHKPLKQEGERQAAPAFVLKDPQGRQVRLADYKGKVVLLNFWASWCQPCRIENPWFVDFERRFSARGFAVVGIATQDEVENVMKYVQEHGINYRILIDDDMVSQLYGGSERLPTTFVLDRQGRIAAVHVGLISRGIYEEQLEQLLSAATEPRA